MKVRKIRLTIEYDPDWPDIAHGQIAQYLSDEREHWMNGDVDVQDLEGAGIPYTFTLEVVP